MAVERAGEGAELPGSEVSGEKQDAFAALVGAFVVFEALIDDRTRNIFTGVTGEEADFGQLTPERDELSAKQAAAIGIRDFREGESEVAEADATQASVNCVDS
jgi:hypothetical protein